MDMAEKAPSNSKSVISLTLGILSIVIPLIGLILGVIGVVLSIKSTKEIENTNETGKGLAVSGLICSIVGIIINLFAIIGILAFFSLSSRHLQFISIL